MVVDASVKDQILLFSCQIQDHDCLYHKEWTLLKSQHHLCLKPAFSQDSGKKIYIQHLLTMPENELFLAKYLLENGGSIYIAGGRKW